MQEYLDYAWNEQLFLLIGIALFLGLGKGGVPGLATIATAVTVATSPQHISGGLGLAVALQVPILTMIDIAAACLHASHVEVRVCIILLPISFVGIGIGQWLNGHLSDSSARLLVGLLLLAILSVQLGKDAIVRRLETSKSTTQDNDDGTAQINGNQYDVEDGGSNNHVTHSKTKPILTHRKMTSRNRSVGDDKVEEEVPLRTSHKVRRKKRRSGLIRQTNWTWTCLVGLIGGAATMLTNAMGPIMNIYLLNVVKLSPSAYVATRAFFFCVLNAGKIPMGFLAETLAWSMFPLVSLLGAVSVLGVFGAKPIMMSIDEDRFVKLELAVVAFSGLQLCWMGIIRH